MDQNLAGGDVSVCSGQLRPLLIIQQWVLLEDTALIGSTDHCNGHRARPVPAGTCGTGGRAWQNGCRITRFGVAIGGIALATVAAVLCTWMLDVAGVISEEESLVNRELLEERVRPGWYSAIAALAAGIAGMLAILKNKSDTLVGTVAAVALVPAAAAAGIALKAGDLERALGGLALVSLNVVLIFAMGVLVLLVLGRGRRSASNHHADGSAPASPSGKPPHPA